MKCPSNLFPEVTMKVADLPTLVIEELCQSEYWRIDIDPGLDAKHEFFLRWEYLLPNSQTGNHEQGEVAELINFDGYDVLLPIGQAHHPHIHLLRLHPSTDNNWLTLFLFDTYHDGEDVKLLIIVTMTTPLKKLKNIVHHLQFR
jgi:hypothetical protein